MVGAPHRLRALCGALVVVLALSGCSQVQAQMDGAEETGPGQVPLATDSLLETVEWGEVNGLLSVLVRNTTDRVLRRADAVVSVRDNSGAAIGTSAETTVQGHCCTAVEVPPGGTFGFYFYVGDASRVDTVDVAYKNVQWSDAGQSGGGEATVTPVNLFPNEAGSVVSAEVTTQGGPIDSAVVQAVIDGPDGRFLSVISGTWFCFVPGSPRKIWMQLYTPVPDGSTIRSITAYPRPSEVTGGEANPAGSCDPAVDASGSADAPTS